MAFSLPGALCRISRLNLPSLGLCLPELGVLARGYAARKGTREKALKKKRAMKMKKAAQAASQERKQIVSTNVKDLKRTVELNLPPVPTDMNVYFSDLYRCKEYTLQEAIECHRENLHPTVLNGENAALQLFIELDLTAEKKTKVIAPWKNIINYPHMFDLGFKRRILVLCAEKHIAQAQEHGADAAGGLKLIRQIKKGEFDIKPFDKIIGQLDLYQDINAIRSKLQTKMPRPQAGTLVDDFISAIPRFKYGVEYAVHLSRSERDFGWIDTTVGLLNMEISKLERNFAALIENIHEKKPKRDGNFVTCIWCSAPPSKERFKISVDHLPKALEVSQGKRKPEAHREIVDEAAAAAR